MQIRTRALIPLCLCLLITAACSLGPAAATAVPTATTGITTAAATTRPPTVRAPAETAVATAVRVPAPPGEGAARRHLLALTGIGRRLPGSREEARAAKYIESVFVELGYAVERQPFSFGEGNDEAGESANVIAVKPGRSPREIIAGAHYDSTGDSAGADDNASGVAVLLTVAEMLKDESTPYTVRLIAFGAEENGLNGSYAYVDELSRADIRNTVAMINLDSLVAGDFAYVYGDAGPKTLRDWIMARAQAAGLALDARTAEELDQADGTPCECADYSAFQAAGIPFAYFEATNWNVGDEDGWTQVEPEFGDDGVIRHTCYDNVQYLDRTFPGRIDQHLHLFTTLLYDALTHFEAPE